MKDLKTFLFESQGKSIPNNNPYFIDGTASEDLVYNSFQGDAETRWLETHKGEIIEYTTEYFKQCVKNKTKLTPEEFGSDYISYIEQYLDEIPKKERKALENQFISLIDEEC